MYVSSQEQYPEKSFSTKFPHFVILSVVYEWLRMEFVSICYRYYFGTYLLTYIRQTTTNMNHRQRFEQFLASLTTHLASLCLESLLEFVISKTSKYGSSKFRFGSTMQLIRMQVGMYRSFGHSKRQKYFIWQCCSSCMYLDM